MPIDTQKRNKRQYTWQKETSDRINFLMPKGYKDLIYKTAGTLGLSASEFIRSAIEAKLKECGVEPLQSSGDML